MHPSSSSTALNKHEEGINASRDVDFISLHPFVRATVQDKIRGTIVGSALGDCIGLYTEFLQKAVALKSYPGGKFQLVHPVTEFLNDDHRNKFELRAWTDDTDHALLILLSYLHHDGKEPSSQDLAERLRTWVTQGLRCLERPPAGLGQTVASVVCAEEYLTDPSRRAYERWVHTNRSIAPNGSLMRTHPLGAICLSYTLDETFATAAEFSVVTHADPRCVVACCISTGLIRGMLRGEILREADIDGLMEDAYHWVNTWVRSGRGGSQFVDTDDGEFSEGDFLDRGSFDTHVHANTFGDLQLDEPRKIGYVYKCLGSAVLSLRYAMRQAPYEVPAAATEQKLPRSTIFENIITKLTFEAGDADTNGSAAGALVGCWLGYESLPAHWRDGMMHIDWMVNKCDGLSHILGVPHGVPGYRGSKDPDTCLDGGKGLLDSQELAARDKAFYDRYMERRAAGVEQAKKRLEEERKQKSQAWRGVLPFSGR